MTPQCSYSKKSQSSLVLHPKKSKNLSVVTAISKKGLIGIQIVKGSITGTDFACFLLGIIKNHKDIEENLKEYYFFMDNASIHKRISTQKFLHSMNIFYNAPYSPFLNPIENFFGLVKKQFRELQMVNPEKKFLNVLKAFKTIKKDAVQKTIRKSWKEMLKCLNGDPYF